VCNTRGCRACRAGHPTRLPRASAIDERPHGTATDEKNPRGADWRKGAFIAACICRHGQTKCRSHPGLRRLKDQLNPTMHGMSSPSPVPRCGGRPGATGDTRSSGVRSAGAPPGNRGESSWSANRRWRRADLEVSGGSSKRNFVSRAAFLRWMVSSPPEGSRAVPSALATGPRRAHPVFGPAPDHDRPGTLGRARSRCLPATKKNSP
jgi:hypothetical protein